MMERIFKAINNPYDQIRLKNDEVNRRSTEIFSKINCIREKYNNHASIESMIKTPKAFTNSGRRSFATLLYNGHGKTLQKDFFGQLDSNYYDMCYEVFNACASRIPVCKDDFSKIFSFMGAVPVPVTIPCPSTGIIRENQNLPRDPSKSKLDKLRIFIREFFSKNLYVPDGFVFKISSTGNPGFPEIIEFNSSIIDKNNSPYREEAFRIFKKSQVLRQNQFYASNQFKDILLSNDLNALYDQYEMLYFYTDQHRGQPDRSSKERFGYTSDNWSRNNPDRNKEFHLDKDLVIDKFFSNFSHLKRKYGEFNVKSRKWRFVFAESSSTNTVPNLILSCLRHNYGENYAFTYKCGDHITVNKKIDEYIKKFKIRLELKDILVFDISQFDNSISPAMLEYYIRGISDVNYNLGNELAKLSTAPGCCNLPYINLDIKSLRNKNFLLGDPFDIDSFLFGTSPSGTADVSEKAKLICSFFVLNEIVDADYLVYDKIMSGEDASFLFLNLGDNNFILCDKSYKAKEKLEKSDIFKVDLSNEMIFGGLRFEVRYDENRIVSRPNAGSFLMKMLAPERPLDDEMRSDYLFGLEYRAELAQTDDQIAFVLETIDRKMMDMFGCSEQLKLARLYKKRNRSLEKSLVYIELSKYISKYGMSNLSIFFKQVVESGGDKLFYTDIYEKLSDSEKKIIDKAFFSTFEEEEISNILKFYFRG